MDFENLLRKLKEYDEQKDIGQFCVDCMEEIKFTCIKERHTIIYKDYDCNEVSAWIKCLEWLKKKEVNKNEHSDKSEKNQFLKVSEFILPPGQSILQSNRYQLVVSPLFNISKVVEYISPTEGSIYIHVILEDLMAKEQKPQEPNIDEKEKDKLKALAEDLLKKFTTQQ